MSNILFVNKLSPNGQGGAEARIREVARRLAKADHAVYILCARTSLDEPASEMDCGVHILYVPVLPNWILRRLHTGHYLPQAMFYLVAGPAILSAIRRWKIDVIRDSISPFPGLGLLTPFVARRSIAVTHILFGKFAAWRRYYGCLYGFCGYFAERLLLANFLPYRCLITDSNWLARQLEQRRGLKLRVRPVLNGIYSGEFFQRQGGNHNPVRILNVARCTVHKSQRELLDACAVLESRHVTVQLTIVGDGPLSESLKRHVSTLGLNDSVHFAGLVPPEQMKRMFSEHDILVIASESEGLPVTLLEAMASRLPVVAPRLPYITDLMPQAEQLLTMFEIHDPQSLAAAISECISAPEAVAQKAIDAWNWVQELTWEKTAAEEWDEMERMLSMQRRPHRRFNLVDDSDKHAAV